MNITIGTYHLTLVSDGSFALDAGAMFGRVPRTLWRRLVETDERNRMRLALLPLLIRYRGRFLLVDTGIGTKLNQKYQDIYRIDHHEELVRSLEAQGVRPEDIELLVFTHLHFDHSGGATYRQCGSAQPRFPRARCLVQRREWNSACHPTPLTRGSYVADDVRPLASRIILVDGTTSLARFGFPGVRLIATGGHTPGHQVVEVEDARVSAAYVADLIPTSHHLRLPYVLAYDTHPLETVRWKRRLLERYAAQNTLLIWEHDTRYTHGTVLQEDGTFRLVPQAGHRRGQTSPATHESGG